MFVWFYFYFSANGVNGQTIEHRASPNAPSHRHARQEQGRETENKLQKNSSLPPAPFLVLLLLLLLPHQLLLQKLASATRFATAAGAARTGQVTPSPLQVRNSLDLPSLGVLLALGHNVLHIKGGREGVEGGAADERRTIERAREGCGLVWIIKNEQVRSVGDKAVSQKKQRVRGNFQAISWRKVSTF